MPLTISIDLDDDDLKHFRSLMRRAKSAAAQLDDAQVVAAASSLLKQVRGSKVTGFIRERIERLDRMIAMVGDEGFGLPAPERRRVISALAYFADPEDTIPDATPGLGFLDDAIMIELVSRELQHEIQAYDDFCAFRSREAKRLRLDAVPMTRERWMETKRRELIGRIRRRRGGKAGTRSRSPFSLW